MNKNRDGWVDMRRSARMWVKERGRRGMRVVIFVYSFSSPGETQRQKSEQERLND